MTNYSSVKGIILVGAFFVSKLPKLKVLSLRRNQKTVREIRNDLKDIKYYYSRKDKIDRASECVGANGIYEKVEKYNKAICKAPLRMYDLYVGLYQENNTLESLADSICYSFEYVAKLNQKLVKFFEKYFNEEKGE